MENLVHQKHVKYSSNVLFQKQHEFLWFVFNRELNTELFGEVSIFVTCTSDSVVLRVISRRQSKFSVKVAHIVILYGRGYSYLFKTFEKYLKRAEIGGKVEPLCSICEQPKLKMNLTFLWDCNKIEYSILKLRCI